jgi:hypothetical protein
MNPCRVACRVVFPPFPQNPCILPISLSTSATKLFRRSASKGTILGPSFWLLSGGAGAQQSGAGNRGAGVWLLVWCQCACRVAFALATLSPLFPYFTWATKESSAKGAR